MSERSSAMPHPEPPVELLNEAGPQPELDPDQLVRALAALMGELGAIGREVTVVLVRDAQMAERNHADRGEEGPTDVLSYPTFEPGGAPFPGVSHLGDMLLNVDAAGRQAAELGHSTQTELLQLAAHALVHLLGNDHETPAAWAPFNDAQARIVELARELGGDKR